MRAIRKAAQAGTLESNDVMVMVAPGEAGSGVRIDLQSNVLIQYGDAIRSVVAQVMSDQSVTDVTVKIVDRGALDCTIQARVLAALLRAELDTEEADQ